VKAFRLRHVTFMNQFELICLFFLEERNNNI